MGYNNNSALTSTRRSVRERKSGCRLQADQHETAEGSNGVAGSSSEDVQDGLVTAVGHLDLKAVMQAADNLTAKVNQQAFSIRNNEFQIGKQGATIKDHANKHDAQLHRIDRVETKLSDVDSKVKAAVEKDSGNNVRIGQLERHVQRENKSLWEALTGETLKSKQLNQVQKGLTTTTSNLAATQYRLGTTDRNLAATNQALGTTRKELRANSDKVASMEAELAATRNETASMKAQFEFLKQRFEALEAVGVSHMED
ncbi:hypothetical protein SMACR_06059 [Sordaria macrospora]|uniref:WGS project CABT00000000 data, contig 2.32 n=2 Tax=Sordaria macrospora TaxID=5147 RepID=F7W5X9_SORMK|nr:uncharacterized protein SMAC_06059 [Sordaria macrospora k-hell]KAA8629539.1 hypothetical protein SMACR_06059 [Sordaria macrospora]KAH7628149.1 hypothetical protein B0T09DRAFT_268259 [Sordaria sp. MPI-SDFR-AT-0083]WPJ65602.1 hypothetical protein SMAC4_06059 [Sordaria macrospora]CCC12917.1 unnamed protein product [Sordaria macrospora k-hell]